MSRTKKLILLLLVLIVCLAAYWIGNRFLGGDADSESVAIASYDSGSIEAIRWIYDGNEIELTTSDGKEWAYAGDEDFPLDQDRAVDMASAVASIYAVKKVSDEPDDLARYGLEEPSLKIFVTADGEETEFDIGAYNETSGYYYLMYTGDTALYYVDTSLYETFSVALLDLAERESLPEIEISDVESLEVKNGTKTLSVTYYPDGREGYDGNISYFIDGSEAACDTDTIQAMIESFIQVSWDSCAAYNVTQEQLAEYGLDKPTAEFSIRYQYTVETESESGETETLEGYDTLLIGRKTEDTENETYYAMILAGQCVYTLSADVVKQYLISDESGLYSKTLLSFYAEELTELTVTYKGTDYAILAEAQGADDSSDDIEMLYTVHGASIELETFVSLLSSLTADSVQALEISGAGDLLLAAAVTLSDGTQQSLEIYDYDDNYCAVKYGGKLRYFASESACDDLYDAFKDALKTVGESTTETE